MAAQLGNRVRACVCVCVCVNGRKINRGTLLTMPDFSFCSSCCSTFVIFCLVFSVVVKYFFLFQVFVGCLWFLSFDLLLRWFIIFRLIMLIFCLWICLLPPPFSDFLSLGFVFCLFTFGLWFFAILFSIFCFLLSAFWFRLPGFSCFLQFCPASVF